MLPLWDSLDLKHYFLIVNIIITVLVHIIFAFLRAIMKLP